MDYNKMTKAELVSIVKEQKHLASAVQAKDKEIADLKREFNRVREEKSGMITKERYDSLAEQLKSFEGSIKKDKLEEIVNRIDGERRLAVDSMLQYRQSFEDLLRVFKVNLDIAISTNDLLSSRFKINNKE